MGNLDILFKEYDALRAEVLAGLQSRNTIVSIGLAALGVMWTGAVGLREHDSGIMGLVLALGVPGVAMCFLWVWYGEYKRVQNAGAFLYDLESKINTEAKKVLLTRETMMRNRRARLHLLDPIVILFCLTGYLSVLAGERYLPSDWPRQLVVRWWRATFIGAYVYMVYRIGRLRKKTRP